MHAYGELSEGLRALAMRLVREESTADDVVQEAWLAALDARPEQVRDLTSWLRKVVVNLARRTKARSMRRREIEAFVARPEALAPDREVDVRSTHTLLIDSISRLNDPYRTVLTMRYVDGLDAGQIAAQRGNSAASVRSQIQRGLIHLRAAFDRSHDGRRSDWAQALLPFAMQGKEPHSPTTVPDLVASAQSSPPVPARRSRWIAPAGVGATLVLVATVAIWRSPTMEAAAEAVEPELAVGPARATLPKDRPAAQQREASAVAVPDSSGLVEAVDPARDLEVLVRRLDGSPAVEGYVTLNGSDGRPIATADYPEGFCRTDLEGRVTITIPERRLEGEPWFPAGTLGVNVAAHDRDEAWSATQRTVVPSAGGSVTVYCRGPAQDLALTLVDEAGAAVEGAIIILHADRLAGLRGHDTTDVAETPRLYMSDSRGEAHVYFMPTREHRLAVYAPEKPRHDVVVFGDDPVLVETLVIPDGTTVYGRVQMPDGSAAAGARVWCSDPLGERESGRASAATDADADGYFELEGVGLGPQRMFANARGDVEMFACTVLAVQVDEETVWEPILAPTTPLRVRMVDEAGNPVPGAVATLVHPGPPVWASAGPANREGRVVFWQMPAGPLELLGGVDSRYASPTVVTGVTGQDEEIELPVRTTAIGGSMRGTLCDGRGAPLPGAWLVLSGGGPFRSFDALSEPATGKFGLRDVPPGSYLVAVRLPGLGQHVLGEHQIEAEIELDMGEVRVPLPIEVELQWGATAPTRTAVWQVTAGLAGIAEPFRVRTLNAPVTTLDLVPGHYRLGRMGRPQSSIEFTVAPGASAIPVTVQSR